MTGARRGCRLFGLGMAVSVGGPCLWKAFSMPVATAPEILSPMLLGRLQAALPPEHLEPVAKELSFLLTSIANVPPITSTTPPLDKTNPWSMAKVYQWLTEPGIGAEQGPLSSYDQHTAQKVHYL